MDEVKVTFQEGNLKQTKAELPHSVYECVQGLFIFNYLFIYILRFINHY